MGIGINNTYGGLPLCYYTTYSVSSQASKIPKKASFFK